MIFLFGDGLVLNDNTLMKDNIEKSRKTFCRFREKPYLCKPIIIN